MARTPPSTRVIGGRPADAVRAATLVTYGRSVIVRVRGRSPGSTSASQVLPNRGKVTSRDRFRRIPASAKYSNLYRTRRARQRSQQCRF